MAICLVTNRSSSQVIYKIPENNIRREFAPGETKKINSEELDQLIFQPGGREIMANFLLIQNEKVVEDLNLNPEPEYYMTEDQVRDLLLSGSYDAFVDALNFAPMGVIDLIKDMAVVLPLENTEKKLYLKEKTGMDLDKILANLRAEAAEANGGTAAQAESTPKRAATGRRTNPDYKVVKKDK